MIPPNEVELGVLDGRLHVGVVPAVNPLAGLNYHALYTEVSQLYCARGHPLYDRPDESVDDDVLAELDAVAPTYALPADVHRRYQALNCTATASDREGIAFLILTQRYIGYLPDHVAERWVGEGRLRAVRPETYRYTVEYNVITRKGRRPHLVLETFLEQLTPG
jgi:DNA-binding transcriptional LysR family regulator